MVGEKGLCIYMYILTTDDVIICNGGERVYSLCVSVYMFVHAAACATEVFKMATRSG